MRRDVLELRAFYASPRGAAAREMLGRKVVEAWGDCSGLDVLGLGYATPFLDPLRPKARRVIAAMPAAQGVEVWPGGRGNLTVLADEFALPLANALFDRILCVHALEESESAAALLTEVCRVLAPSGRVIVAAAARNGLWSNAEGTPFGHGRPFTRGQLETLLREVGLEPTGYTRALYAPPFAWARRLGRRVRADRGAAVARVRRPASDRSGETDLRRQAARVAGPNSEPRARNIGAGAGHAGFAAQEL